MNDGQVDLKKLIDEAERETYNPRAKRCGWWSHEWTMWQTDKSRRFQTRRCVGCGLEARNVLAKECPHQWITVSQNDIYNEAHKLRVGIAYYLRCENCGDRRRKSCA